MPNGNPLKYALSFEETSDIDSSFTDGVWNWENISVPLLINEWFGAMKHHKTTPETWWIRCRREDGSSEAMLEELRSGGHLREPVVLTLGGMNSRGSKKLGITDGCHRIVACHLAGVSSIRAAIGVFPDANPDFVSKFCSISDIQKENFSPSI